MPETGRLIGTPASMSESEPPQTDAIDDEPFELGDVAGQADRVGEFFLGGQHAVQRAPCQLAMADFATARRAEAADFADRIRREVIVQHEVLVAEATETIDHLLAVTRTERAGRDRLGLSAGEQSRAVRARQEVDFRNDRTDRLGVAAVDAAAFLEDRGADDVGLKLLHQLEAGEIGLGIAFLEVGHAVARLGACLVDRSLAGLLVGQLVGGLEVLADQLLELGLHFDLVVLDLEFPRLLGCLLGQLDDRLDHLLALAMREHHGAEHDVFRKLLGFGFDHHHRVLRRSDDEVEETGVDLLVGRVEDIVQCRHSRRALRRSGP